MLLTTVGQYYPFLWIHMAKMHLPHLKEEQTHDPIWQCCALPATILNIFRRWSWLKAGNFWKTPFPFQPSRLVTNENFSNAATRATSLLQPKHGLGQIYSLLLQDVKIQFGEPNSPSGCAGWGTTMRWARSLLLLPLHIPKRDDADLTKDWGP